MKRTILTALAVLYFCSLAIASEEKPEKVVCNNNQTVKVDVKPQVIIKWKTKYVDKVVYRDRVVYKDRPIYKTVTKEVVKWKTKTKTKVVEKKVPVIKWRQVTELVTKTEQPMHNLSLMLGTSKTYLDKDRIGDYNRYRTAHELDVGLSYAHRIFDDFNVGLSATVRQNIYLNLGVSW